MNDQDNTQQNQNNQMQENTVTPQKPLEQQPKPQVQDNPQEPPKPLEPVSPTEPPKPPVPQEPVKETVSPEPSKPPVSKEPPKEFIPPQPPKKEKKPFNPAFILVPFIVIFGLILGSAFFVVYGKSPVIPFKLKMAVSSIIFKVPFLPKTTEYVVISALSANQNLKSSHIESSISISSQSLVDYIQSSSLDIDINGGFDFIDENNPRYDFNIAVPERLDLDYLSFSNSSYFRLNELDLSLLFPGIESEELDLSSVLNYWVKMDHSVSSETVETLESAMVSFQQQGVTEEALLDFFENDLVPLIKMDTGTDLYVLTMVLDQNFIQTLWSKFEEWGLEDGISLLRELELEDGRLDVFVNSETYMVEALGLGFAFTPDVPEVTLPGVEDTDVLGEFTSAKTAVTLIIALSDHNVPLEITEPDQSLSVDEYFDTLLEIIIPAIENIQPDESLLEIEPAEDPIEEEPEEVSDVDEEESPFGRILP